MSMVLAIEMIIVITIEGSNNTNNTTNIQTIKKKTMVRILIVEIMVRTVVMIQLQY